MFTQFSWFKSGFGLYGYGDHDVDDDNHVYDDDYFDDDFHQDFNDDHDDYTDNFDDDQYFDDDEESNNFRETKAPHFCFSVINLKPHSLR